MGIRADGVGKGPQPLVSEGVFERGAAPSRGRTTTDLPAPGQLIDVSVVPQPRANRHRRTGIPGGQDDGQAGQTASGADIEAPADLDLCNRDSVLGCVAGPDHDAPAIWQGDGPSVEGLGAVRGALGCERGRNGCRQPL